MEQEKFKFHLERAKSVYQQTKSARKSAEILSEELWGDKMTREEITKSLTRHLFAYLDGEDIDEESGCKHIWCMMANLMFLEHHTRDNL